MTNIERLKGSSLIKACPFCGKEYRKKEFKSESDIFGSIRYIYLPDCNCADIRAKKFEKKETGVEMKNRIKSMKDCGIGKRFKDKTFSNYIKAENPKALAMCHDYAKNFVGYWKNGEGLFLYGKVGTGKTHLTCAIIDYISRIHKTFAKFNIVFTSSINLTADIKLGYEKKNAEEVCRFYEKSDLLIIDDLGSEKITDWVSELFYRIIDNRYTSLKPVIITTNYSITELKDRLSERFISRIFEMCKGVQFFGDDMRISK